MLSLSYETPPPPPPNRPQQAREWEKTQGGQGDEAIADNAKATEKKDVLTAPSVSALGGQPSASVASTACSSAGETASQQDEVVTDGATAVAAAGGATVPSSPGKGGEGHADDGSGDDGGEGEAEAEAEDAEATKNWETVEPVELSSPAVLRRVAEKLEGYRLPEGQVAALRETLKGFVGTKNYHNYTNHKQPTDPSCKR